MPSVSGRQHRFWGAMLSHPKEAKKRGISTTLAHEFLRADKGRHFPADKPKGGTAASGDSGKK